MKKFLDSKIFYFFLSFVLAVLLFFNANSNQIRNRNPNMVTSEETYNATINNLPIDLKYDEEKYYVSGFEGFASVYLTSYNRIRLDAEKNEATRSFSIVADLTSKKIGTHDIQLKTIGLNQSISAEIDPKEISVTIEKKMEKTFPIRVNYDKKQVVAGYSVDDEIVKPKEILVTSGESSMKQIAYIAVNVPKEVQLDHDYVGVAPIKAYNKSGQEISISTKPDKAEFVVKVAAPSKEVKVVPVQSGTMPKNVLQYNFMLNTKSVWISGPPEELAKVETIQLPVVIDGVNKKEIKVIPFNQELYSVKPGSVEVTIDPVMKTSKSNETSFSEQKRR